jgi:DNA-binding NtrC family response regulator
LDEAHVLPTQVQRSLLRFAEDGVFCRIGDDASRPLQVRLVLGTNLEPQEAMARGGLAFDLVNRLHHVHLPPLAERRADIPEIFKAVLAEAARRHGLEDIGAWGSLHPDQLEALCLVDLSQRNVRELIHVADAFAIRVSLRGEPSGGALGAVLAERYPDNPVVRRAKSVQTSGRAKSTGWSKYERHRAEIISAYRDSGENLSATARALKQQGIRTSRRHLADYLARWGERR